MLSALLNSIQSSLGSRGFVIGSLFPVLVFVVGNGALLYRDSPWFRSRFETVQGLSQQTFLVTALLLAITILAYILSAATSVLLETLEGKHRPVSWFNRFMHRIQRAKLGYLEKGYWLCVYELGDVEEGIKGEPTSVPPVSGWIDRLNNARAVPRPGPRFPYPGTWFERWTWRFSHHPDVGLSEMGRVRRKRAAGIAISAKLLQQALEKLEPVLAANSVDRTVKSWSFLDADCDLLIESIYFSRDRYQAERIRLFNLRRFQFPVDLKSVAERSAIILAPTKMGNIGGTMRSYAQKHYGFDLEVLWTRLQNASQSSDKFYTVLQDAKVQLDFFVATTWFAVVTTIAWVLLQLLVFRRPAEFLYIGMIGPVVSVVAYQLSCRAYSVFADLMRSCVDLFRFKVLTDLHLPLPPGLEEEKAAWQDLANLMGYENTQSAPDKLISVTYKH
jgi:hypothetical protein